MIFPRHLSFDQNELIRIPFAIWRRVRWADIEEMKEQERAQAIGFVVGQSKKDWERMTEAGAKDAQSALKRTRFIPHRDDDKEVVLQ